MGVLVKSTFRRENVAVRFSASAVPLGLAVEHGRITLMDGTMVAESLQTRLTVQR